MSNIITPTNEYQTPLTEELLNNLPKEVRDDVLNFTGNVEFIKRLISPNRKKAKDCPRDPRDPKKIIVDVCNPHILENMDYFRPIAIHYKKYNKFTLLRPNPNKNSEYMKWFLEEIRRIWYGYVRPSDGEWITGDHYWYLNYCTIKINEVIEGSNSANRFDAFPDFYEGDYLTFHYKDQARWGGIYNNWKGGQHCALIASRGVGKSYKLAALLVKLFLVGENAKTSTGVKSLLTAYEKTYLENDGTLSKFMDILNFLDGKPELGFAQSKLKSSLSDLQWKSGYKDNTNSEKGSMNEVSGVTSKDNTGKLRGKRSTLLGYEEFGKFPNFIDSWNKNLHSVMSGEYAFGMAFAIGCVCAGTKVWDKTGKLINIEDITDSIIGYDGNTASIEEITYKQPETYKECVRIVTEGNRYLECSIDHPLLTSLKPKFHNHKTLTFKEAVKLNIGDHLIIPNNLNIFGTKRMFNPRLIGILIGDGSYGGTSAVTLSINDNDIYNYVNDTCNIEIGKLRNEASGNVYAQVYFKGNLRKELKNLGIDGQVKHFKRLPDNISDYCEKDICELLGGYFDADGNVQITKGRPIIKLTCKHKVLIEQVRYLLLQLGINSTVHKEKKGGTILNSTVNNKSYNMKVYDCYVLYINNSFYVEKFANKIKLLSKHKQVRLDNLKSCARSHVYNNCKFKQTNAKGEFFIDKELNNIEIVRIKSIENIGVQRVYNLTANTTNTYITNGFVSSNTGGEKGSSFSGAIELIDNPLGYKIYGVPNVFDLNSTGNKTSIMFWAGYLNRMGCYNKDGVSDVTKALIEICNNRYTVKYNTNDPVTMTITKAEIPITLRESIMLVSGTMFPVAQLNDRKLEIEMDPNFYTEHYIGRLSQTSSGEVIWKPDADEIPIRTYPLRDQSNRNGALEIFEMPIKDKNGTVPSNRYILSADPIDDDGANTSSLFSVFVLDLYTDRIVAEYTGRYPMADECYELLRLMCIFYNGRCMYENNKKGLFAYFSNRNCLYLLADVPQTLKDMELMKGDLFGNRNKGFSGTVQANRHGRRLLRDFCLLPITIVETKIDEDGMYYEDSVTNLNLNYFRSKGMIEELSQWNEDGNFDRVSALTGLMIYREEMYKYTQSIQDGTDKISKDYLGNDDFFKQYENNLHRN